MDSSQSRLLDTQYILEYEPSPTLIGKDTLCKPLQTQNGCYKSLYQPVICNQQQAAADRSERKRTTGSIGLDSNALQKRGRWRNKNYKRDGVLDLWFNAGLPLHAVQPKTS
ncbi:hypothetical protein WJX79_009432 [Trebouxia sp. C0005]